MGSQTQPKLPVIEITKQKPIPATESWISTSNEVRRALEDYGCFVLSTDQVSPDLHNTIFNLSKQLFDCPVERKIKNTPVILGSGYSGKFSTMPLLEYLTIIDGATIEATESFTNLLWPSGNPTFYENVLKYSTVLKELNYCVMKMVFGSYGVEEKYCESLSSTCLKMLRFMKYRGAEKEEVDVGLVAHTDKTFLSVLDCNEVRGLEFETRNGEWIVYDPSPSSLIVIAGEAFTGWSNGRIYAPLHRVAMRCLGSGEERYSILLSTFMREMIEIPKELVDEDEKGSLKFKSFNHMGFLEFCGGEGRKHDCAIEAYCGTVTTDTDI